MVLTTMSQKSQMLRDAYWFHLRNVQKLVKLNYDVRSQANGEAEKVVVTGKEHERGFKDAVISILLLVHRCIQFVKIHLCKIFYAY